MLGISTRRSQFNSLSFFCRRFYKQITVNHEYFKEWNPENAYVLGYLFADGCVYQRKSQKYCLYMGSSCIDQFHIKNIANAMKSTYQISLRNNGSKCALQTAIYSHKLCTDLIRQGCHPRKSLTLAWPQQMPREKNIVSNFILGYFDGDGCIHCCKTNGSLNLNFVGTAEFLQTLQQVIRTYVQPKAQGSICTKTNSKCNSLQFNGNASVLKIFDFLYSQAPMHLILQRKYLLYTFYKSISCLSLNERKKHIELLSNDPIISKLKTCQINPDLCKHAKKPINT